jgi:2-methylcitrate dehydratase PrpD
LLYNISLGKNRQPHDERKEEKMTITEQLLGNILETRLENVSPEVVKRGKETIIDTIGCTLTGVTTFGVPMIVDMVKEWGGREESTILGYGVKAPSHHVALANSLMARSNEQGMVDVYVDGAMKASHTPETIVPTALAIAEQKGLTGKDLLTAVIMGEDFAARMIIAQNAPINLSGTSDSGGTFSAVAVAGRLWGLNKEQLHNAFGIALHQMGDTAQALLDRSPCWKISHGLAAQHGIFSVKLAGKGFLGLKDPFFGKGGYFARFSPGYNPEVLVKDLGKKYWGSMAFKPFPQCRGTHGATEAAVKIINKHHIDVNNVQEINVILNTRGIALLMEPFRIGWYPPVNAHFSLQYIIANVLLRGYPRPEHFTEESIRDPRMADLMKKVIFTTYDWPNDSYMSATVRVKMKNGDEFSEHANSPLGNEIDNPLSKEAKIEKYLVGARFSGKVGRENAEKALKLLDKLEEVKDITKIINLLVSNS